MSENARTSLAERAFLGLGANLGNPKRQLEAARAMLGALPRLRVLASSGLYQSAAIADEPQPDYLNSVLAVSYLGSAEELLANLLRIELLFGRVREAGVVASRTLDLDLLLFGDLCLKKQGLVVPHPRMLERAFVLKPLSEIASELVIHGRPVSEWLAQTSAQRVIRLPAAEQWDY
jgi:2-amino-4-hydroxy-6-hydroxymethyldihydropteridine diphosphokinase